MGAVDVGIGEQDDLVIAGFLDVVIPDAGAHGGEDVLHFGVLQGLGQPCLLDIEDLARMGRIAWVLESRADLAGPAADLPSTMNSSDSRVPR